MDSIVKIAIMGKEGVEKTTFSGILARMLVRDGYDVLAIDADADMNFSSVLDVAYPPRPLTDREKMIDERAERDKGYIASLFLLLRSHTYTGSSIWR